MTKMKIYPVERNDYLFYIRAAVGGIDDRSKVVRLLVDTGARNTVLPAQLLQEFGYDINKPVRKIRVTAAGGILQVPIIATTWFSCLGTRIESFEVIALDLPNTAGTDGLLGMDFLTEIKAIVDVDQAQILLR